VLSAIALAKPADLQTSLDTIIYLTFPEIKVWRSLTMKTMEGWKNLGRVQRCFTLKRGVFDIEKKRKRMLPPVTKTFSIPKMLLVSFWGRCPEITSLVSLR
jgi:hypothetical protein